MSSPRVVSRLEQSVNERSSRLEPDASVSASLLWSHALAFAATLQTPSINKPNYLNYFTSEDDNPKNVTMHVKRRDQRALHNKELSTNLDRRTRSPKTNIDKSQIRSPPLKLQTVPTIPEQSFRIWVCSRIIELLHNKHVGTSVQCKHVCYKKQSYIWGYNVYIHIYFKSVAQCASISHHILPAILTKKIIQTYYTTQIIAT